MADREVIGVELIAKLDQYRAEFKSLPKTTDDETKAAVSLALKNLNKLQTGAAKTGKDAKAGLKPASDGIKELGDTAGDTDSSLKALAGAVGLISPAAETALSSVGDLAGGIEGAVKAARLASVSLGAIGLAAAGVAAVASAVYLVWDATEDARAKTREWEEALADVATATRTLSSAKEAVAKGADDVAGFVGDLQIQTALLRGEIDETDIKLGELGNTLSDKVADDIQEANKALGEQSKQLQILYTAQSDASLSAKELAANELAIQKAQGNYDAIKGKITQLEDLRVTANAQIQEYGVALRASQAEEEKSAKKTASRASATRSIASATEDAMKAEIERREAVAALEADLAQLGTTQRAVNLAVEDAGKSTSSLLAQSRAFGAEAPSAVEKTRAEYLALDRELLKQIETNEAVGISTETLEAERVDLAKRTREEIAEIEAAARQEQAEQEKAAAKAYQEEIVAGINETLKLSGEAVTAWSDLISGKYEETQAALTKAKERGDTDQVESLEKRAKKEKALLTAMFRADQAVKLSQVVMDTAAGISSVWARWGHRPVFAGVLTGLVTATGIAQGAAIAGASPQYHTGGIVRPEGVGVGVGEVPARLIPGEVVMSRQAVARMGGAASADRLNRNSGMGLGMGGSLVIEQRYGHRVFDEVVYDDIRRPDSSLRKAVSGRARVGHRAR